MVITFYTERNMEPQAARNLNVNVIGPDQFLGLKWQMDNNMGLNHHGDLIKDGMTFFSAKGNVVLTFYIIRPIW